MTARRPGIDDLSDDDRRELESWLAEFGRDWGDGSLSERAGAIPPGSPWRFSALAEVVKIDMERQWRAGNRVGLESYLLDFPELGRRDDVPVDLIRAEYDARRESGDPADLEEFARRFPRQAEALRRAVGPAPPSSTRRPSGSSSSQELPERFGRYRIVKRLGQGGMGSVFLAEDTQLGRRVALKVSHFDAGDSGEARERFSREARAAATLDHPYLCPVYDVGVIDGVQFLTMAYIEGKTLAASVREGGLPQRQVAAVIGKIAVALQEAHARGVVHRDLKPSNVMIKETGQRREPVIVDFGLARQENAEELRVTKTGQAVGTPAYMAPEQIRGNLKEIGPASDVYALGVILYELLTGRLPFTGSGLAVVGQILTQEPLPPSTHRPDLDPRLEAVCLKAMAKKASARYASMSDLAAALTDYLKNPTPSSVASPSQAIGPRPEGVEARVAGSDTLVGQFLDQIVAENALAPLQINDRKSVASPVRPRPTWLVPVAACASVLVLGAIVYVAGGAANEGRSTVRPTARAVKPVKAVTAEPPPGRVFEAKVGDGVWTIEGDEVAQSSTNPPGKSTWHYLAFGDPSWSDYDMTLEAKAVEGSNSFGVLFHWLDDGHNLGFGLGAYGNTGSEVRSMFMGRWGRKPEHFRRWVMEAQRWYRIKMVVRGASFQCFLDDVPYFQGYEPQFTRGLVGLCDHQTAVRFRRIRITSPDGKLLFAGVPALPTPPADDAKNALRLAATLAGKKLRAIVYDVNGQEVDPEVQFAKTGRKLGRKTFLEEDPQAVNESRKREARESLIQALASANALVNEDGSANQDQLRSFNVAMLGARAALTSYLDRFRNDPDPGRGRDVSAVRDMIEDIDLMLKDVGAAAAY